MEIGQKNERKQLSKTDTELLYCIYKYRFLSTSQVKKVGGLTKWSVYKKISYLRKNGYIHSYNVKGNYILNQSRQGRCHRISGKGISYLKRNGYTIETTADSIKVNDHRLVYLLTANDLGIPLTKKGWIYTNSADVKSAYELNRGDILQGSLTNPDKTKEYALYVFLTDVHYSTLYRIKREISRNPFQQILVVTRGKESFDSIIHSFLDKDNKLIKGGGVKILPLGFAKQYLNISNDHAENHRKYLESLGITILGDSSSKNVFGTSVNFEYLVKYQGEEMYFMDLLDNDLMKLDEIRQYRKEEYEKNGRKVLVLTSEADFHSGFHKKYLSDIQHIEYLTVSPYHPITFVDKLYSKNTFESDKIDDRNEVKVVENVKGM